MDKQYNFGANSLLNSVYENLNFSKTEETVDILHADDTAVVERILSSGQTTDWQNQDEAEFCALLKGDAEVEYEDGSKIKLTEGDTLFIAPHTVHRVSKTSESCVWLCFKWWKSEK